MRGRGPGTSRRHQSRTLQVPRMRETLPPRRRTAARRAGPRCRPRPSRPLAPGSDHDRPVSPLSVVAGKSARRGSARPRSSALVASVLVSVHAPRSAPPGARSAIVAERPPGPAAHAKAATAEPRRSSDAVRTSAAGSHDGHAARHRGIAASEPPRGVRVDDRLEAERAAREQRAGAKVRRLARRGLRRPASTSARGRAAAHRAPGPAISSARRCPA